MEDQCSPLSWGYYYQEERFEELKHTLLYTTLELETTILSAQEEIARKEDELIHLKELLTMTIREREEAQAKCQSLMLDKFLLQQQLQQRQQKQLQQKQQQQQMEAAAPLSGTTSNEDEPRGGHSNTGFSSSDCDENIITSPGMDPISQPPLPAPPLELPEKLVPKKPLPEKGKFLQAVMEAGPLLQTLLLAGPLPQWQHPPPQLNSIEIPPVAIPASMSRLQHQDSCISRLQHQDSCISTNGCFSKKRGLVHCEASDSSPNSKFQKVAHQSPLTNQ